MVTTTRTVRIFGISLSITSRPKAVTYYAPTEDEIDAAIAELGRTAGAEAITLRAYEMAYDRVTR
jgi:hypothetical protein